MIEDDDRLQMKGESIERLQNIEARLYCLTNALRGIGNNQLCIVSREIWDDLRSIVLDEYDFREHVKDQVDKFQQGFAYKKPFQEGCELEFEED